MSNVALSFRRFPDTIIRYRTGRGGYVLGQFVPGKETSIEIRCAVQPLSLEDSDFAGGAQTRSLIKIYVPQRSDTDASPLTPILAAAFDEALADQILWEGKRYTVEESRRWPRYTRAVCIRET